MNNIIYPELSYKLMGVLFKVHNTLGPCYQEKYYQRAIEQELIIQKIPYKKEYLVRLNYREINIGRYYIDFVIDDKIALEVKSVDFFRKRYFRQVLAYLDSSKLKLGVLVNFNG